MIERRPQAVLLPQKSRGRTLAMKTKALAKIMIVMTVIYGLCPSQAFAISSSDRIFSELTVSTVGDFRAIEIGFNFRVRYVSHYPQNSGREVRITFEPIQANLDDLRALEGRESLFPPSNNSGVIRVEYEGDSMIDPTITVVFDRTVSYEVKQGDDFRSLVLMIPEEDEEQKEAAEATGVIGMVSKYVINLITRINPIEKKDYPSAEKTEQYTVYTTTEKKNDNTLWNRLSVGFFNTFAEARKIADSLFIKDYPELWIVKASPQEVAANGGPATTAEDLTVTDDHPPVRLDPQKEKALLKEGNESMVQKDYPRAIQIYTKLLESSDPVVQEQAQFQLALAREYNGHLAHARAEYRNYIRAYPQGPGFEEARNRLKNLLRAQPLMGGGLKDGEAQEKSKWESEYYGSISTFYEYDESFAEDDQEEAKDTTNVSSLTTSIDATYRLRSDRFQLKTVFIGSYESSFLDEEEDDPRVSALYLDVENTSRTFTSRWGRQSGNSGGVLGRFDGGKVGYLLTDKVRLNLVAGFPVNLSSDPLETERYFYGINFDLGRFSQHWDYNLFLINQIAEGVTDRRAVGGEVRYVGDRGSFFTLLDYDILFGDLNTVLLAGNWLMANKKTWLNFSADFRNSPVLTASNALFGQTERSLEALETTLGEDALHRLAKDRTLYSKFVTVGFSHPFSDDFQIAGDVSWSKLDGAPASGGVEEIEDTDNDWYYSLQFINSNIFTQGDISTVGFRYADTEQRDTYTMTFNTRYPVNDAWRINPRLQIDYRTNKIATGEQWRFRPSLRIEYKMPQRWRFEVEGGYSYANAELEGLAEDREGYYVSVGLRKDF